MKKLFFLLAFISACTFCLTVKKKLQIQTQAKMESTDDGEDES